MMKIAVQLGRIPGQNPADKAKWAKDHGIEGIELNAPRLGVDGMRQQADEVTPHLPVSSVCGNCDAAGARSSDLLHPDRAVRRASIKGCIAILKFCGEVGAAGQIVPPIFGPPLVPDLSPFMSPLEIEDALMVEAMKELGPVAAQAKTLFLVEPLNRYEQHYLKRQADGVRVLKLAEASGVTAGLGLLSDFFHMHIEETDTPAAFREAAGYTQHIHLADNTRMEPGSGDIDFVAAFQAIRETGFTGYMAYECGITGSNDDERKQNLSKSVEYLRQCMAQAGA